MTTQKHFTVFDGDSHVVEPRELWEEYLDPEYRVLGKSALWRERGRTNSYLKVNGKVFRDTGNPNIPRHAIWQPGMTWESVGALDPDIRHPEVAGASDPQARIADMDALGIDQTFLYPTWFAEGFHLVEDPDVAYALARAYNDWISDFCKAAPDRLFAAAMVPLQDMDMAIAELRRVSNMSCFRGAFIRPMFREGHYFTHPYYDPLWGELEELQLAAAVHPTPRPLESRVDFPRPVHRESEGAASTSYHSTTAEAVAPSPGGGTGEARPFISAGMPLGHPLAPAISNWLDNHMFVASALIGFTVMQRFPEMKVVVSHGKASWMEEVLEKMEASSRVIPLLHYYPVRTDPEEMWEEGRVMLGFDAEERLIQKLPHLFEEKIVWGSNYPHHDTTSAWDAIDQLRKADIEDSTIARMMGQERRPAVRNRPAASSRLLTWAGTLRTAVCRLKSLQDYRI